MLVRSALDGQWATDEISRGLIRTRLRPSEGVIARLDVLQGRTYDGLTNSAVAARLGRSVPAVCTLVRSLQSEFELDLRDPRLAPVSADRPNESELPAQDHCLRLAFSDGWLGSAERRALAAANMAETETMLTACDFLHWADFHGLPAADAAASMGLCKEATESVAGTVRRLPAAARELVAVEQARAAQRLARRDLPEVLDEMLALPLPSAHLALWARGWHPAHARRVLGEQLFALFDPRREALGAGALTKSRLEPEAARTALEAVLCLRGVHQAEPAATHSREAYERHCRRRDSQDIASSDDITAALGSWNKARVRAGIAGGALRSRDTRIVAEFLLSTEAGPKTREGYVSWLGDTGQKARAPKREETWKAEVERAQALIDFDESLRARFAGLVDACVVERLAAADPDEVPHGARAHELASRR